MSQAKITLRPPPNVDFVQGYPGIPPGPPDRPQAAVKGAIELRVGPQGIKAKWVRIELRKVETLPGGGLQNTFFDFVGQSPLNLWQSGEDYGNLTTQDFPFSIRIPESIPPSIMLEKGAGIKYELIATVCVKEKKGFLRRDKAKILPQSAPIHIDKHELHSTWPVYAQPDTRSVSLDNVTLTVERTHTCFGPGDRIAVNATVKSDSLHTVVLRGFEFSLKETIVYRAGPNAPGKRGAPQVKVGNVGEQKVPVNATIYGGQFHKAELVVTVPPNHTSTTLNSARHIDITYVLVVKALMATGKPIVLDLPVIISNWPRSVSVDAVPRIGLASNVSSHLPHMPVASTPNVAQQIGRPIVPNGPPLTGKAAQMAAAAAVNRPTNYPYLNAPPAPPATTITDSSSEPTTTTDQPRPSGNFSTAPPQVNGYAKLDQKVDEWGYNKKHTADQGAPLVVPELQIQTIGTTPIAPSKSVTGAGESTTPRPRPNQGRQGAGSRTLSVANYADDMPEEVAQRVREQRMHGRNPSVTAKPSGTPVRAGFATAEEEKQRLFEGARMRVEQAQSGVVPPPQSPTPPMIAPTPVRDAGRIAVANGLAAAVAKPGFMSAEEEKARLFVEARAKVEQAQGLEGMNGTGSSAGGMSAGALLYSQAMSSMKRNASAGPSAAAATSSAGGSSAHLKKAPSYFPTAEEEKAALARRFDDARAAVERAQQGSFVDGPTPPPLVTSPISYEPPYTPTRQHTQRSKNPTSPPPPGPSELPPAFDTVIKSSPPQPQLSEKERMRRAFEERDKAMIAQQAPAGPDVPSYDEAVSSPPPRTPPPAAAASSSPYTPPNAGMSEKERFRQYFEEQDRARTNGSPAPPMPLRSGTGRTLPTPRGLPTASGSGGASGSSSRVLSAAEEKARLAAMYAAEEHAASSGSPPPFSSAPPPSFPVPVQYPNGATNGFGPSLNGKGYTNGYGNGNGSSNGLVSRHPSTMTATTTTSTNTSSSGGIDYASIPPPPPLMPRPPREYIKETQEEDQALAAKIDLIDKQGSVDDAMMPPDMSGGVDSTLQLDMRPFSPFRADFQASSVAPGGVKPPLPPKVPFGDM